MKIISRNGNANDIQVEDNDGNNLLEKLDIMEMTIKVKPNEKIKVILECSVNQMNIEANDVEIIKGL